MRDLGVHQYRKKSKTDRTKVSIEQSQQNNPIIKCTCLGMCVFTHNISLSQMKWSFCRVKNRQIWQFYLGSLNTEEVKNKTRQPRKQRTCLPRQAAVHICGTQSLPICPSPCLGAPAGLSGHPNPHTGNLEQPASAAGYG